MRSGAGGVVRGAGDLGTRGGAGGRNERGSERRHGGREGEGGGNLTSAPSF